MSAKSFAGILSWPNRNAAPQCVLLLMNESLPMSGLTGASLQRENLTSSRTA